MEKIAKEAGVARSTVSFVLNDKWKEMKISEKTRDHIVSIVNKHHYLPHATGRNLVTRKTRTIGIAVFSLDYFTSQYFAAIVSGIVQETGKRDYRLQLAVTSQKGKNPPADMSFKRFVKERSVDGLIIIDQYVAD